MWCHCASAFARLPAANYYPEALFLHCICRCRVIANPQEQNHIENFDWRKLPPTCGYWTAIDKMLHSATPIASNLQDIVVEILSLCSHSYESTATYALKCLLTILRSYTCFIPAIVPTILSSMAGLTLPSREEVRSRLDIDFSSEQHDMVSSELLEQLIQRLGSGKNASTSAELNAAGCSFFSSSQQTQSLAYLGILMPLWHSCRTAQVARHASLFPRDTT